MRSLCILLILLGASVFPGNMVQSAADDARENLVKSPGDSILAKVDENINTRNKQIEASMIIHGRRGNRTVVSHSWIQGTSHCFTEYLDPPRERGTKMLKLDDKLWIYTPNTDRTIRISGHMLRQSVMGSDLSYEDLMEDPKLHQLYSAKIAGKEVLQERPCWVLDLTAREKDITYYTRRVWVDRERFLLLKENRYAKSGKLLKVTNVLAVRNVAERWVASHIVFKDALKHGDGTEFVLKDIQFDIDIPSQVFSKASLRK